MKYKSLQSGFSLAETLVAITILLLVIVGPMTIISTTSNSTSFASEQVVAFFLAQEGAELAQKARDDAVILRFSPSPPATNPWTTFVTGGTYGNCYTNAGCGLEISNDTVGSLAIPRLCNSASANNPCRIYYDASSGAVRSRYNTSGVGTQTNFTRVIKFEDISLVDGTNQVRVTSEVSWFTGQSLNAQTVEVETYLFDVYGN